MGESSRDADSLDADDSVDDRDEYEAFWRDRISPEDRERAINLLRRELPLESLRAVHALVENKDPDWPMAGHIAIGLTVRNMLRDAEFPWDDVQLDELWDELLEEAARRAAADERSGST